mmetsp:Transcript_32506/g.66460  ORF Transcript_32506/g.66460 Transcript_32506/m.66460 type:complete len:84 (+) Transcript_32506:393-644(+)
MSSSEGASLGSYVSLWKTPWLWFSDKDDKNILVAAAGERQLTTWQSVLLPFGLFLVLLSNLFALAGEEKETTSGSEGGRDISD